MTLPPRRFRLLVTLTALSALVLPVSAGSIAPAAASGNGVSAPAALASSRAYSATAMPAAAFVDSIGVNTHLQYDDTAYARYDDVVKPRLLELGVRHIRDAVLTYPGQGADSAYYRKLRDLAGQGIRFNLSTGMDTHWGGKRTDFSKLADVQRWAGNGVESFEGVNEPDLQNVAGWAAEARSIQQDLARTVRSTPSLQGTEIVAPSVTTEEAAAELGDLSAWTDEANLHNYPSDRSPETTGWGSNGYGSLGWNLTRMAGRVAPTKPVVTTETGFYTAPIDDNGISEKAAGGYTPRLLLNQFRGGVKRTYLYEMLRQRTDATDREANFGLVRADGSRTPSYLAVRSLIDLLESPARGASAGSPATLGWTVGGDTTGLQQLPLRTASGEYVLALWTDDVLWDNARDRDVAPGARRIQVTPAAGQVVTGVATQADSGEFVERPTAVRTADVSVGPRLTFLRLAADDGTVPTPAPGPGTGPGTPAPPVLHVHGQGRDTGGDVRRGKEVRRGAPVAKAVDLRAATISAGAGRVRLRVVSAGNPRLTRRDTLTYTVRASGGIPVVRWDNKRGLRTAKAADPSCRMAAARPRGRRVLELSVPAACLPQDTQMRTEVATALKRTTPRGPRWWVDTMKGPTLSLS